MLAFILGRRIFTLVSKVQFGEERIENCRMKAELLLVLYVYKSLKAYWLTFPEGFQNI